MINEDPIIQIPKYLFKKTNTTVTEVPIGYKPKPVLSPPKNSETLDRNGLEAEDGE